MENLLHIFWALLFQSYHLEKLLVVERFSRYRRWKARELLREITETYVNSYPWFSFILLRVLPWEAQSSPAVVGARCTHCNPPCFTDSSWNKQRGRGAGSPFCRRRAELLGDGGLPKVTQEACGRVGSWSLTRSDSFQCLNPPLFFFLLSFTLKRSSESGLWLLDSCHFLTFPPLEKKPHPLLLSHGAQHWREVFRSTWLFPFCFVFPEDGLEISVAFRSLKVRAMVVCKLGHCKGVLCCVLPARPAVWGTVAGEGEENQPRALEIGAEINEFTCSTSPGLSPHPLLSRPRSLANGCGGD